MSRKPFVVPEWMEPMREQIESVSGGNTIEEVMNDPIDTFSNLPLALIKCSVEGAVIVLARMKNAGFIFQKIEDSPNENKGSGE